MKRILGLFFVLLLPTLVFQTPAQAIEYPLHLAGSAKTQYVADSNNQPFFINGDTPWSLIVQLNEQETIQYLDTRVSQGYNAIMVNLIEHQFADNAPKNAFGQAPFSGSTFPSSVSGYNESYFTHADWVIEQARQRGMAVFLVPLYLGYGCGNEGWCGVVQNSTTAQITTWAQYVGNRYANFDNVLYVIGGDTNPTGSVKTKTDAFATTLKQTNPQKIFTAHNSPENAAMNVWNTTTWLDLNNIYTYGYTYDAAWSEYNRSNFKPFFMLESAYDNEHSSTATSLRSTAYWAVLSGATLGHFYGNCPVWHFNAPSGNSFCNTSRTWQNSLTTSGANTVALIRSLMESRDFVNLVPDLNNTVLTGGIGSGSSKATAAQTANGTTIIVYSGSKKDLTLNLSKIPGNTAKAWWYDPTTGNASLISSAISTSGSQTFSSAGLASHDWVLVVDAATANLPAPGSSTPTPDPTPTSTPSTSPTNTPTIRRIPGDVNLDGRVDLYDYQAVLTQFGGVCIPSQCADITNDGIVNIFDYSIVITNFGAY